MEHIRVGILAGGLGSRLAEETESKPKPMVEIGGKPMLWHIMKIYRRFFDAEFYVALGYKGEYVKKWMVDYCNLTTNLTVDFKTKQVTRHSNLDEDIDWRVHLIDTGQDTNTGGRIKRLGDYLGDKTAMVTWGDGVADIDIRDLLAFHRAHGKLATLTAVRPAARFGHLRFNGDHITEFSEKPQTAEGWINGAFFVFEPGVYDYIDGDAIQFEKEPLERLAADGQLMAYRHESFWQCMDTIRDKKRLEEIWDRGQVPWLGGE